jgi:hypothetical protein
VLYFKNRDAVDTTENTDNRLNNEEVYLQLCKTIKAEHIDGIQRIGGLWRLYIPCVDARCKLLAIGIDIRGRNVTIHENNPFLRTSMNTVVVRVCGVPLTVHDSEILNTLRYVGAEIVGDCTMEKLRVGGKLVNCLTGNRRVLIKTPKEPLPRFVAINDFKASLHHPGQQQSIMICSNCLETGHYKSNCTNPVKCRQCKKPGHMQMDCTVLDETERKQQPQTTPNSESKAPTGSSHDMPTRTNQSSTTKYSQGKLQLKAGKLEITLVPKCHPDGRKDKHKATELENNEKTETEFFSDPSIDSRDGEESVAPQSETSDDDNVNAQSFSSMSAKSPSPNHQNAKRKQKEIKRRRRSAKSRKG